MKHSVTAETATMTARRVYITIVLFILVISLRPGLRKQFAYQTRQIVGMTQILYLNDWPAWRNPLKDPLAWTRVVSEKRLRELAERSPANNGEAWQALAEIRLSESGGTKGLSEYELALAAGPSDPAILARYVGWRLKELAFLRPEIEAYEQKPSPDTVGVRLPEALISPSDFARSMELVGKWKQVEPLNALSDYSQAYLHLGARQDDKALAEVEQGVRKPVYGAHFRRTRSRVQGLLLAAGVPQVEAAGYGVYYGDQSRIARVIARTFAVLARKAEDEGDWAGGWRIRLAAFRMGSQMVRRGATEYDRLVGQSIQTAAMAFPLDQRTEARIAGAPATRRERLIQEARTDALAKYIAQRHPGPDGAWVMRQYRGGLKFRGLVRQAANSPERTDPYYHRFRAQYLWYADTILLAQFYGVLALFILMLYVPSLQRVDKAVLRWSSTTALAGVLLTVSMILRAGWPWWLFGQKYVPAGVAATPLIPAGTTWAIVAIPFVMLALGGSAALMLASRDKARHGLRFVYASVRFAIPALAVAYVVFSMITASYRGEFVRHTMREFGHQQRQVEMQYLKQSGLL